MGKIYLNLPKDVSLSENDKYHLKECLENPIIKNFMITDEETILDIRCFKSHLVGFYAYERYPSKNAFIADIKRRFW